LPDVTVRQIRAAAQVFESLERDRGDSNPYL